MAYSTHASSLCPLSPWMTSRVGVSAARSASDAPRFLQSIATLPPSDQEHRYQRCTTGGTRSLVKTLSLSDTGTEMGGTERLLLASVTPRSNGTWSQHFASRLEPVGIERLEPGLKRSYRLGRRPDRSRERHQLDPPASSRKILPSRDGNTFHGRREGLAPGLSSSRVLRRLPHSATQYLQAPASSFLLAHPIRAMVTVATENISRSGPSYPPMTLTLLHWLFNLSAEGLIPKHVPHSLQNNRLRLSSATTKAHIRSL